MQSFLRFCTDQHFAFRNAREVYLETIHRARIDRIFRDGKVVDYLDVELFTFAIFNFADIFVTVGTALLAVYILFFMEKDDKRLKAPAEPPEETHDDA